MSSPAVLTDREIGLARLAAHGLVRPEDLAIEPLRLELPERAAVEVRTGPRVGVAGPGGDGGAFPWRFWVAGDPTVSVYRPAMARKR